MIKKPFGILGGMGPEASLYFCSKLIKLTQVEKDQDHIPFILYNNPEVPDRTNAILGKGPSPLNALKKGVKVLKTCDCSLIVIPCNSAHYYFDDLKKGENIPFLNMVEETLKHLAKTKTHKKKIGIIATSGTIKSGLYSRSLRKHGLEFVVPPDSMQEKDIMTAIYQVKSGYNIGDPNRKISMKAVLEFFVKEKVDAIIQGCTEVPLFLNQRDSQIPLIDPMAILAQKIISLYGKKLVS